MLHDDCSAAALILVKLMHNMGAKWTQHVLCTNVALACCIHLARDLYTVCLSLPKKADILQPGCLDSFPSSHPDKNPLFPCILSPLLSNYQLLSVPLLPRMYVSHWGGDWIISSTAHSLFTNWKFWLHHAVGVPSFLPFLQVEMKHHMNQSNVPVGDTTAFLFTIYLSLTESLILCYHVLELELDRYKFVVQVIIGEQRGEGVK